MNLKKDEMILNELNSREPLKEIHLECIFFPSHSSGVCENEKFRINEAQTNKMSDYKKNEYR